MHIFTLSSLVDYATVCVSKILKMRIQTIHHVKWIETCIHFLPAKLNHVILNLCENLKVAKTSTEVISHLQCVKAMNTHSISNDRNNNDDDTVNIIKNMPKQFQVSKFGLKKNIIHTQHAPGNNISHLFTSNNFALASYPVKLKDPFRSFSFFRFFIFSFSQLHCLVHVKFIGHWRQKFPKKMTTCVHTSTPNSQRSMCVAFQQNV